MDEGEAEEEKEVGGAFFEVTDAVLEKGEEEEIEAVDLDLEGEVEEERGETKDDCGGEGRAGARAIRLGAPREDR
jgi:hypothetical protein